MFPGMSNKEDEGRGAVGSDSSGTVRCVPTPSWVQHHPWPQEDANSTVACSDNGLLRVLCDGQIGLLGAGVAWHLRTVQRILTRSGAERAAHVAIEFNPAHERVYVHCIRIWRGEQSIEQAQPGDFHILRRETQLERLALDGRLTATLLVPDLRVDDHLEVAFTLVRDNPILGGRCASWILFNSMMPWVESRQRLVRTVRRTVFLKSFNNPPETHLETRDNLEESTWSTRGQKSEPAEELSPPWLVRGPCYQITEFAHWGEVSRLFEKYYQDSVLPAALVAELDGLASRYPNEPERAVEWLRTVQRQLRYFALALGEGGVVPRSLAEIWTKRFGDCKDAARLYVAGARYLGLDACAALVSTLHGFALAELLPSPQVFNHVAVRVRAAGVDYWVDPTMQPQGGSLANITLSYTGWALPLTAERQALERLPSMQPVQHIHCEDVVQVGATVTSAAVLERRIDFGFWMADGIRNRIEGEGVAKVSDQLLTELKTTWPNATEKEPLRVQDDFANNRLSVLCVYELPDCWKPADQAGRVGLHVADPFCHKELTALKSIQRKSELFLGRPRKVSWRARLQMPRQWQGSGWHKELNDSGIRFLSELTVLNKEVVFEREVQVDDWSAGPDKAGAYAQIVAEMRRNSATLLAYKGYGDAVEPAASPRGGGGRKGAAHGFRWAAAVFGLMILLINIARISSHTDSTTNSYIAPQSPPTLPFAPPGGRPPQLDRGFVTAPEAHVNSFGRVIDPPLESCIDVGRDSKGPYLHSSCTEAAKVKVARPSGGEPLEIMIYPGSKSYVYLLGVFGDELHGALAACPSGDQIVDSFSKMPWVARGSYLCQHSLE